MTDTTFIRLLDGENRPARLREAVKSLREGTENSDTHHAAPDSFRQVPGSPFAYWVSEDVRQIFSTRSRLEANGRDAQSGASTMNDFRFLRLWWETSSDLSARRRDTTLSGKRWVPFAKGGTYSRFYTDWELTVDWRNDGEVMKEEVAQYRGSRGWGYSWTPAINGHSFYFRPGLSWPRRTQSGLNVRVLPMGCIIGDKGPTIFKEEDCMGELSSLLAVLNSSPFRALVSLQMAFGSYEVGVMERTPIPDIPDAEGKRLGELALDSVEIKRGLDSANETSHAFRLPALRRVSGDTLAERVEAWRKRVLEAERDLAENQREIDGVAFDLYGISGEDRAAMEGAENAGEKNGESGSGETDEPEMVASVDGASLAADLVSYAVGCAFGRWDVRMALDASLVPDLADPFAPLPVCSPGTLTGPDAMPVRIGAFGGEVASMEWLRTRPDATRAPEESSVASASIPHDEYPLEIDRDGILADDPDRPDDIVRRVRGVFETLFGENADGVEAEVCEALGVKNLRAYFMNPRKFFDHHTRRYSKSRRKAPIYWLLQSPKKKYALWLYYHRLDGDMIFKALSRYLDPKIRFEEDRLTEHEAALKEEAKTGGSKPAEKAVAASRDMLADLREFRKRLARAASLDLAPELDDGVVLNIAPLHEVVPWKEAKIRWDELLSGKHEWSSIACRLREKGLV